MKKKKITTVLCSLALVGAMGISLLGGCKKQEEHAYVLVSTDVQATCVNEGRETYRCGICGDVITKTVPVDPDAHVYGDWRIDPPTGDSTGTANRTCTLNSSHTLSVTLPKLSESDKYASSDITTPPTSISKGVRSYVYSHPTGDIVIDVEVPVKEVENLYDAVLLGTSLGHLVRSASGTVQESRDGQKVPFETYYGDNYTNVKYRVNALSAEVAKYDEFWYSHDVEGNVFGVYKNSEGVESTVYNPTEEDTLGYGYASGVNGIRGYGAENTLKKYYEAAQTAVGDGTAVKYSESFEKLFDGSVLASFTYRHAETPSFAAYTVSFELAPNGVIRKLTVETKHIRPFLIATTQDYSAGEQLFDDDGDIVYSEIYPIDAGMTGTGMEIYDLENMNDLSTVIHLEGDYKTKPNGEWLLDRDGNKIPRAKHRGEHSTAIEGREYYSDDHEYVIVHTLAYDAPVLKAADDVVPPCPYETEDLYIHSFNLVRARREINGAFSVINGGATVGDEVIEAPSNASAYFEIVDILPATASVAYDPVGVYLRTKDGDIRLTENMRDNAYNVAGGVLTVVIREPDLDEDGIDTGNGKILETHYYAYVNSRYAGEMKIAIKSSGLGTEKVVNFDFAESAPTVMMAQVYLYSDATGEEKHIWTTCNFSSTVEMYVGQRLYVRGKATDEEEMYCDTRSLARLDSAHTDKATVTNDFVDADLFGTDAVSVIEPTKTGDIFVNVLYAVDVENNRNGATSGFLINVKEKPTTQEMQKMFRSTYTVDLSNVRLLEGGELAPAVAKVTFTPQSTYWYRGEVEIDINTGSGYGNTAVYTFVYDSSADTLTCEFKSGLSNGIKTLDFTISLNEMYKLTLTHSTGFGAETETKVLQLVEAE